ncbi:MAG: U32 family peptidase [Spirochaetales bacterium]|nr:U32 family peptidase [Spirochaetales bacterium]
MDFAVSTNWDIELINKMKEYPVYELLGSMAKTPVGGGRPAISLPAPGNKEVEEYIKEVHRHGMKFNYLLNTQCMGNMEFDSAMHKNILKYLEWLCEIGIDSVTVTIPYLIEIIKKQFPGLKIKVSVIAIVDSIQRAKYFEEMGVDEINIDYMSNRDFVFLKEVRKAVQCPLVLLVNDVCLYQCPYRTYHYNSMSHASQEWSHFNIPYIDYCIINCTLQFIRDPKKLIMARWIRPEDLGVYEELGFSRFKISGRVMSTSWLIRAVKAYAERHYDGNLFDILAGAALKKEPDKNVYCYIDNNKLDSFLEFFKTQDCKNKCWTCHYCERIAEKAVSYNQSVADYMRKNYEDIHKNMVESRYFS